MIHYHGGPITPESCARRAWAGRHAFNIGIDSAWRGTYQPSTKETRVDVLVERIESTFTPHDLLVGP